MSGPARQEQEIFVDSIRLSLADDLFKGNVALTLRLENARIDPQLQPEGDSHIFRIAGPDGLFSGEVIFIGPPPPHEMVIKPIKALSKNGEKARGLKRTAEASFEEELIMEVANRFFLEKTGLIPNDLSLITRPVKAWTGKRGRGKPRIVGFVPEAVSATFLNRETGEVTASAPVTISDLVYWLGAKTIPEEQRELRLRPEFAAAFANLKGTNHLPIKNEGKMDEIDIDWKSLINEVRELDPRQAWQFIKEVMANLRLQKNSEQPLNYRALIWVSFFILAAVFCVQSGKWDVNNPPFQSTPTAVYSADNGDTTDSGQGAVATPFLYPTYPSNEPEYCKKDPIILPDDPQALLGVHFNEYGPFTVITPGDNMKDILRKFGEVFGRKGFWNSVEQLINQYIRSIVDKEDETESSGAKILWLIPRDQDTARIKSQSDQMVAAIHFVPNATSYMTFDVDSSGEVIPAIAVMHNKYFDRNLLRTVPGGEQLWEMLVIMGEAAKENRAYQRNGVIIHPQYREQVTGREEFRTRKAYSVRNVFGDSLPQNEILEADSPMTPVFAPDFIEIEDVLTGTHFSDCYFGPAETISMVPTGTAVNIDAIALGRDYQQDHNENGVYPARLYARVSFTGVGENLSNRPFLGDKTKDAYYELMKREARQFWVPLDHLAIPDPKYKIGS